MCIEPAALTFTRSKGKKIFEDTFVNNDAADQGHQHDHGKKSHQPDTGHTGMKLKMHMDKVMTTLSLTLLLFRNQFTANRM